MELKVGDKEGIYGSNATDSHCSPGDLVDFLKRMFLPLGYALREALDFK